MRILLLLLFVLIGVSVSAQVNLNQGLLMYLPFNGNTNDVSGNGNNAVNTGATLTTDKWGNPNGAYHFDGNDYMRITANPALNNPQSLTLYALVKPERFYNGPCYVNCIIDKANGDYVLGNYGLRMVMGFVPYDCSVPDTNDLNYRIDIATLVNASNMSSIYNLPRIQENEWDCVIGTYDGTTGTANLYVNGVFRATYTEPTLGNNGLDIFLGRKNSSSYPYWFTGVMDEVRIYNRALNTDEIDSLCNFSYTACTPVSTTQTFTFCDTNAYTLPDGTITHTSGTYIDTLQTVNGCDSIITTTITYPPVIHISRNSETPCDTSQLDWATWTSVNADSAYGAIGSNLTMTVSMSTGGLGTTPSMFSGNLFPTQYSVPTNSTSLQNQNAGIFTFCFSQPVTNPQVAFASIGGTGSGIVTVPITTSVPYEIIWQGQGVTYPNDTTLIGTEGYTIIRFPGTYTCISFNYQVAEYYCNLAFGVQDISCQNLPVTECANAPADTLHASGAVSYTWTPSTGLNTTQGATVIARPTTSTTYHVTGYDINGCSATDSFTIIIDTHSDTAFATASTCSPTDTGNTVQHLINQYGCDSVIITSVSLISNTLSATGDTTICEGDSTQLHATGGSLSYSWTPATGLSNPDTSNPLAVPNVTTQYIVHSYSLGQNLVTNGNFSAGNIGFSGQYISSSAYLPNPGYYTVGTTISNTWYTTTGEICSDHTPTNSDNMMLLADGSDGSTIPVGSNIWCQTVSVDPNTNYAFSVWLTSLDEPQYQNNPAILSFSINGVQIGNNMSAPTPRCQWVQFFQTWNSGSNNSVDICIADQFGLYAGNDFALDDIYFAPFCDVYDTVTVVVNQAARDTQNVAICQGESFTRPNGTFVTTNGTYIDTLQTTNGCDSIITINLVVNPTYSDTQSALICSYQTFTRPNGSIVNTSGTYIDTLQSIHGCDSIITTNLTVNLAVDSTIYDTICSYQTYMLPNGEVVNITGTYTDSLSAANGCGIITTHLTVINLSLSNTSSDVQNCFGDSTGTISIAENGGLSQVQYAWSNSNFSGTNISNVPAGNYTITATDHFGCTVTDSITISQPAQLTLAPTYTEPLCYGEASGTIYGNAQGGTVPYHYSIMNQENNSDGIFGSLIAGNYTVSVIDNHNCTAQATVTVTEPDSVYITYSPPVLNVLLSGVQLNVTANYDTNIAYSWLPTKGLSCANCPNPIVNPDSSRQYVLTITVTPHGKDCVYEFPFWVNVHREHTFYLPNAFSPNGNGENDYFQIFTDGKILKQLNIKIFNRWGEMIYESWDEDFKWDGRFKGNYVSPGVYVYDLNLVFMDNLTQKLHGSITVIR